MVKTTPSKFNLASTKSLSRPSQVVMGIVTARFNPEVTGPLELGALEALRSEGITDQQIQLVRVPGAFEIPLAAKTLLENGCDAVLALGAVIRGETAHFDYVCSSVERGCSEIQLQTGKPIAFGVLTTDTEEQALARAGGAHGNKGAEASLVALEMLGLLCALRSGQKFPPGVTLADHQTSQKE